MTSWWFSPSSFVQQHWEYQFDKAAHIGFIALVAILILVPLPTTAAVLLVAALLGYTFIGKALWFRAHPSDWAGWATVRDTIYDSACGAASVPFLIGNQFGFWWTLPALAVWATFVLHFRKWAR